MKKRRIFSVTRFSGLLLAAAVIFAAMAPAARGREYNGPYQGQYLNRAAFPLGGIGAGMICIEGTGAISHVSVRNKPEIFNEPCIFSAICVKGAANVARILEGPLPKWKYFGNPDSGNGSVGKTFGLPRFDKAVFRARFPFAKITLADDKIPLKVTITAWSPFTPPDADDSSLPVAALEYTFTNPTDKTIEAVYSFNSRNFMAAPRVPGTPPPVRDYKTMKTENGFILYQPAQANRPAVEGAFAAFVDTADAKVNCAWFRGRWFDALTMAWKDAQDGKCYEKAPLTDGDPSPGGTIFVPLKIEPDEQKTVRLMLCWYVGKTDMRLGKDCEGGQCADNAVSCPAGSCPQTHTPWYAGKFKDIDQLADYWRKNYDKLREKSRAFSDCFYDTTLADEVIEAVAANLTILKSPTVLRQVDGRLWCFEGCCDATGCCHGSCTHVWNYAQAIPNLFPTLERTLRQTEFNESQDERGHQQFRSALPIRPLPHDADAAADGQLGGIMKVYRDWQISGDTKWLKSIWPKVRKSLGAKFVNEQLFNGEYFYQKIQWKGLRAENPTEVKSMMVGKYSPEAVKLLEKEGPKYQYGTGCLSDGVLGAWMAELYGLGDILEEEKIASHLASVHKYNLRKDLTEHANPQRPTFALGTDGGLLLCSWPKGGMLSLPFVYSDEVWTGIEYQVASHLILKGKVEEGLEIVRTCRDRYDGRVRNPFNEYECGHWYARAMSSYALLQSLSGARYDAVEKILYLEPKIKGDFRSFLCTAGGYGTVGVKNGKAFLEVKHGKIPVSQIRYLPN